MEVYSDAPSDRRVHSDLRGFTWEDLVVVAFIRVRIALLLRDEGPSGSSRFTWVHSGATKCRLVYSFSRGFTQAGLGIVGDCVSSLGRA